MTKTAEAFRTISEVAEELEVPKHVLRFWEGRFPQIRPMKRGGGRRYYRPEDMSLLRGICHLLHAEGYTIKGVQKILREQGVDTVKRFGADPAATAAPVAAAPAPAPAGKRAGKKTATAASAPRLVRRAKPTYASACSLPSPSWRIAAGYCSASRRRAPRADRRTRHGALRAGERHPDA